MQERRVSVSYLISGMEYQTAHTEETSVPCLAESTFVIDDQHRANLRYRYR